MKEDQIEKASFMAGLITHTQPADRETDTLNAWTREHIDNQQLIEELTDVDKLNQYLTNYYKYKSVMRLRKINQRIFGHTEDLPAAELDTQ